ncbi:MAG: hypothetical protein IT238_07330 [Bacteroidia bacterium]|nr:hypothetical protein [Bacteroidia bacterium]MCZ2247397.1 hypothetical protein [Bacteroidia bacterium]
MHFQTKILLCVLFFVSGTLYAQNDSTKTLNQTFFVSAGLSAPVGDYATTNTNGGFAKNGFCLTGLYKIKFYKNIEFAGAYHFLNNKLNTNKLADINSATATEQTNNNVSFTNATAGTWNVHSLTAGIGTGMNVNSKLNIYGNIQGGVLFLRNPLIETLIVIDKVSYSSRVYATWNSSLALAANLGFIYKITQNTGFVLNISSLNSNVKGYNLKIADFGNNSYNYNTYKFSQKVSSLNFTLGLSTHF